MAQRKINPNELPSNDLDPGNRPPEVKKLVQAHAKPKKRSLSSEVRKIVNDLFVSIIIPSTKTMLYQFLDGGLQQMILGKSGPNVPRGMPGYNPYHKMYEPVRANFGRAPYLQRAVPTSSDVNKDIYFDTEEEATMVFAAMLERISMYKRVSLMDMRNLCGLATTPTHHRYGWTDISMAEVVWTNEGWLITLPPLEYI